MDYPAKLREKANILRRELAKTLQEESDNPEKVKLTKRKKKAAFERIRELDRYAIALEQTTVESIKRQQRDLKTQIAGLDTEDRRNQWAGGNAKICYGKTAAQKEAMFKTATGLKRLKANLTMVNSLLREVSQLKSAA
jgi:hypothetical protein